VNAAEAVAEFGPHRVATHGCGAWWFNGTRAGHCGGCHITTSSTAAHDRHRRGGKCVDPASVGLVPRTKAYGACWSLPGPEGGLHAVHASGAAS
jgi:hypothetical protein